MHPHVLGEMALGSLKNRATVLESMRDLPQAAVATQNEVLAEGSGMARERIL